MENIDAEVLKWLVPLLVSIVSSLIAWCSTRATRRLNLSDLEHSVYKRIAVDTRVEFERLHKEYSALERAVRCSRSCRHYSSCPVRVELRRSKSEAYRPRAQPRHSARRAGDRADKDEDEPSRGSKTKLVYRFFK